MLSSRPLTSESCDRPRIQENSSQNPLRARLQDEGISPHYDTCAEFRSRMSPYRPAREGLSLHQAFANRRQCKEVKFKLPTAMTFAMTRSLSG